MILSEEVWEKLGCHVKFCLIKEIIEEHNFDNEVLVGLLAEVLVQFEVPLDFIELEFKEASEQEEAQRESL